MQPKQLALVYQAGIANIFVVERFTLPGHARGAVRLYQGAFHSAAAFCAGAAYAGAIVLTASCNQAGDITEAEWAKDLDDCPFKDEARIVDSPDYGWLK